ncbi:L,D-transpeptidase family protein [Poseidonocella sedimentorum]|uniref:L,D-peptidoglycan transpeptidase YkuD, ErfK/YbiS/YcfS/YnhG family n=1 Tax=Poseidonocella sedimentorum TaxID=871652 RepID=A0A1I6ER64_9RHOB|nr:L,D-transpeptidase family protein [Poseidonocella sedimentorum]SFR20165.1 L,D-peptidoglycan transpeptidase YkuD, ErfK/YbiS/YcfS/YnhG family [Poseidonocella sedimentorum]
MTPLVLTRQGLRLGARLYPCAIGRGGRATDKREGDRATPVGTHRIIGMLYRPDRLPRPAPWAAPIGLRALWSDDPQDASYNAPVLAPHAASHERLRRADPLYDLILITDWNMFPARPGRGSAIFLHQWRRRGFPTEGCIALSRPDLLDLARRIAPGTPLRVPA